MARDKRQIMKTRAKKAARMAARKAQRRKSALVMSGGMLARFGVGRAAIRSAPIHRVLVSQTIFEDGIGDIFVSRTLEDGQIALACVLVDPYCLGVKDAFLRILSPIEYDELVGRASDHQEFDEVAPEYARKLIDDAIAYADSLGFEPHEDFDDAEAVLESIDPTSCDAVFTFGKDGKPFYINGPMHGPAKAQAIITQLLQRCGAGGFDYMLGDIAMEELDGLPVPTHKIPSPTNGR